MKKAKEERKYELYKRIACAIVGAVGGGFSAFCSSLWMDTGYVGWITLGGAVVMGVAAFFGGDKVLRGLWDAYDWL